VSEASDEKEKEGNTESEPTGSDAESKTGSDAISPPDKTSKQENRSSLIEGCFKTLKYVSEVSENKNITYRESDKRTTQFLGIALVGAMIFAALPSLQMPSLALVCYITADIFLVLAIAGFVLTRFGVIRAMEPRYALVTWHLMVGTGLLALTIGFNLVAIAVVVILKDQIGNIVGTPLL
jgi:hypothetical protein